MSTAASGPVRLEMATGVLAVASYMVKPVEVDQPVVGEGLAVGGGRRHSGHVDRLGRRQRRAQRVGHDVGDLDAGHRVGADDGAGALAEAG